MAEQPRDDRGDVERRRQRRGLRRRRTAGAARASDFISRRCVGTPASPDAGSVVDEVAAHPSPILRNLS